MESWADEMPFVAITITDKEGKIIDMNKRSRATFEKNKESLIGKNIIDCHPPKAQEIIKEMMSSNQTNAYTIEKEGVKKLIYQTPWYEKGEYSGLIEISIIIPNDMPHYVRR
ncbi:MAG: PAS domain S-box protein [Bacteroidales bacterium]|jgi:transcriptional regulator with PAS, ATPase and Fis domain|nr:PAS domain S-box protein [Bacteroidales bacterium]